MQDYSIKRWIIPIKYFVNKIGVLHSSDRCIYIPIPDKVRREMGLTHYNGFKYRIIIVRED